MINLSVILPVHNEEEIISRAFVQIKKALDSLGITYECILVENGSTDDSLIVIKKLAKKYSVVKVLVAPKGYGSAVIAGLKVSSGQYICYMDSDGQIDLNVFPKLWNHVQAGRWEVVKARRVTRESSMRLFLSYSFSLFLKLLHNTSLIDINASPRILLKKHVVYLDLQSTDSFIDAEFAIKAWKLGWRIKEIPMLTLQRLGGSSTRNHKTYIEFIYNIFTFRFRTSYRMWQRKANF